MRAYSEKELWAFVYRADTVSKIRVAEEWLKKNVKDNDLFDDLMVALAWQYKIVTE